LIARACVAVLSATPLSCLFGCDGEVGEIGSLLRAAFRPEDEKLASSRPLDAVIDTIGGDALESTREALRPNGIIGSVVRGPDATYLRSKGVHGRRHARQARQDLGDDRTRDA